MNIAALQIATKMRETIPVASLGIAGLGFSQRSEAQVSDTLTSLTTMTDENFPGQTNAKALMNQASEKWVLLKLSQRELASHGSIRNDEEWNQSWYEPK